ncbi:MAG: CRTAC1 family protein, partial [Planctomycetota bacterium]|nr:CRTAC1 family protein [Planctomycetota bacterium]
MIRKRPSASRISCAPGRVGIRLIATSAVVVAVVVIGFWWIRTVRLQVDDNAAPQVGSDSATDWFQETARESGLAFTHVRGRECRYWFPEIMSGGAGLFDYDNDGDLDLYLVQGGDLGPDTIDGPGNRLFRNRGDGTFEDVTRTAGVGDTGYGMGCACGDFDIDGDLDLYVCNVGANVLYRNNGDGTFTDVSRRAGVGDSGWGTSCAFLDYDADSDLDLIVVNYVSWSSRRDIQCFDRSGRREYCLPAVYDAPTVDVLYRNQGDGTFMNATESAGLATAAGYGLGVCCGDFNSDGRIDVYVANDGTPNHLWINRGDGTFVEDGLLAGCSVNARGEAEAGMGVAGVDIENDGDVDLFVTHLAGQTNTLYVNNDGLFEDLTPMTGLSMVSMKYTGFGLGFADFDHDGFLDLYIAQGRVTRGQPRRRGADPYGEPDLLLRGSEGMRFEEVSPKGGTEPFSGGAGRGAVFGDVDNDGDIDVVVVESGGQVRLLRNVAGAEGNWIMFRVLDRRGLDAVGAVVQIVAGGRTQNRPVQTAYSYCASNDPRVHFGLGADLRVDHARVTWLGGQKESFGGFEAGSVIT